MLLLMVPAIYVAEAWRNLLQVYAASNALIHYVRQLRPTSGQPPPSRYSRSQASSRLT